MGICGEGGGGIEGEEETGLNVFIVGKDANWGIRFRIKLRAKLGYRRKKEKISFTVLSFTRHIYSIYFLIFTVLY